MKEIKNRIVSKKTDLPMVEIKYLSLETGETNPNGYQEISMASKRKVLQLESFLVQSKVSKEQIKDLSALHGMEIDYLDMVNSALENESEMKTEKLIKKIMKFAGENNFESTFTKMQDFFRRWFGYMPKVRIERNGDIYRKLLLYSNLIAAKSRFGPAQFIIVSGGMLTRIMDIPQFVSSDPNQPSLDQASGFVHKIGIIGTALEVLVDPSLRYDDMTVILGRNSHEGQDGIYYVYMDNETIKTDIVDGETLMAYTLTSLKKRMTVHPTENAHLQYMTFEFTDKPHNIFTHLWTKIQKFFLNESKKKNRGDIFQG